MRGGIPALAVCLLLSGCLGSGPGPRPDYDPDVGPGEFVAGISNPWLPFVPGNTWTYEKRTDEGLERIEVEVLAETRTVAGVAATVVHERETLDGVLLEDTWDWYGQDRDGNVWYLGEDTCEYEDDVCVDRSGAWEWGVDGALPGVIMWADPRPGEPYFQEFYWAEALDEGQVVARGEPVETAFGTFTDTVRTREWTRLEPGVTEEAVYVRGLGLVRKGEPGEPQETLVDFDVAGFTP